MLSVIAGTWSLLLGILLLLVGNGMQGTVLGLRGAIEGFDAETMALVMSGYYVGFLIGSRATPAMIARVGHVRVFSALASLIAAAFVIYGTAPSVWVWAGMRCVAGLCFAGVYVVAESWLNDAATNETRGKALSLYMLMQMVGIISAQFIVTLADPAGMTPFAIMSVLVSIAVTPMLMTADQTPAFRATKPMSLGRLWRISPLGCVGTFMLGGIYAAIFSMGSVFGTARGLSVAEISTFIASIYVAGLIFQYPVGWLSDRTERRRLIFFLTLIGATLTLAGGYLADSFPALLAVGFVMGGVANPLYALVIAYTNDFLEPADMPSASGGLLFVNGLGAISGPVILGTLMTRVGPNAYFGYVGMLFAFVAVYALYRMTRRPPPRVSEPLVPVNPQSSVVVLTAAQEVAIRRAGDRS